MGISQLLPAGGARWVVAVCKLYGAVVPLLLKETLLFFQPRFLQSSRNMQWPITCTALVFRGAHRVQRRGS